jgi:hypothetical protein
MIRRTAKKVIDYHNWYASGVYMGLIFLIGGILFVPGNWWGWGNIIGEFAVAVVSALAGKLVVVGLYRLERYRHRVS